MNSTARAYAELKFEKWWKRNVYPSMKQSKYLAKKARMASWVKLMEIKEMN